jgi:heme a synthase
LQRFTKYAWALLAYNIFVVLWGALVRATGSGAGCGEHWPLCNGQVVPVFPQAHTAIEFTHRITSGMALVFVIGLFWWARRIFEMGTPARHAAFYSLIFMVNETLIGAALVLLGLVAGSRSPYRVFVLSFHLVNTLLLLGSLALTAWWSEHPGKGGAGKPPLSRGLLAAIGSIILVSALGGAAALGDTLFPAESVARGISDDMSRSAPALVRLRIFHPVIAFAAGGFLVVLAMKLQSRYKDESVSRFGTALQLLVFAQFVVGGVNILLLTPLWTQLSHLFVTDLLWVSLVLFTASVVAARRESR